MFYMFTFKIFFLLNTFLVTLLWWWNSLYN